MHPCLDQYNADKAITVTAVCGGSEGRRLLQRV